MGHGRREVRNAAASALGQIGDMRSIPYLVAGLHGNSQRASVFRPSADTAAKALTGYPVETRAEILRKLDDYIRPGQLTQIIEGFDSATAMDAVGDLRERSKLLLDWGETTLEIFVAIDENKAWPIVRQEIKKASNWTISRLLPKLAVDHQLDVARDWMNSLHANPWEWDYVVPAIIQIPADVEDALIVAAAKSISCRYLLTEDLQSGQDFDGLLVVNPFRNDPTSVLSV